MYKKIKTLVFGFSILLVIHFVSRVVVQKLGLLFPSPLLGLIIFTVLIHLKIIPKNLVEDVCNLLLKNMGLFFVPLLVGVVQYYGLIKNDLLVVCLIVVVSTFLTMILTALFVHNVIRFSRLKRINGYRQDD